ncbi:MAG: ArsR family transcriptional regulator [Methanomassiliicoccales archaeon]|nr:MAG: ArsR family transcriptional regulator [Methanomassiliicoccales archaeon]
MCNHDTQFDSLRKYTRALHCPTRWLIIRFIGNGMKSTKEIYQYLTKEGERLTPSGLYYHLSELKGADMIDVAEFKEEGGGAPEKIWKLKTKRLVIDLLEER